MNRIFTTLLAIVMLSQSITALWVVVGFYINQDTIAKTQCIDRFVANSSCHGQCVLMKKLKAQQEKEQHEPQYKLTEFLLFSPLERTELTFSLSGFLAAKTDYPTVDDNYHFDTIHSIFHPPLS